MHNENTKMLIFYAVLFYVCIPGLFFNLSVVLYKYLGIQVDVNVAHAIFFVLVCKYSHKKVHQALSN